MGKQEYNSVIGQLTANGDLLLVVMYSKGLAVPAHTVSAHYKVLPYIGIQI